MTEPVTRDQLSQLLSTYEALLTEGRTLMARLRASMYEMQAQHARLRDDVQRRKADPLARAAAAAARAEPPAPAARHLRLDYGMTPREVEVALLLAQGCANSTVAQRLGISRHTARHHTQRVLVKLGVHSRAEAGARVRMERSA